jgi:hypothetical protein
VDVAVVVNLRARRASEEVIRACRAKIPGAHILRSRSLEDLSRFTRELDGPWRSLLVSAGGDGTAMAVINSMRALPRRGPDDVLRLGVLRLGTGNGWAHATGAPGWRTAIERLGRIARHDEAVPVRRFDLIDVGGTLAHFAGTGWDAEIIDDFHAQQRGPGLLPRSMRAGLAGYLHGLALRTIPRHLFARPPEVELINTGDDALTVDDRGRVVAVPGGGHGAILYRGPTTVCAAGTTPCWGFGFRAFPFAGLVPGRLCTRIYAGTSGDALLHMSSLWRGAHPVARMRSWLLTRCRAVFSRPVPFQIAGDRLGHRQEIEYAVAAEPVNLLDWRSPETPAPALRAA